MGTMKNLLIKLYEHKTDQRIDYTYAQYSDGCLSFIEGTDYPITDDVESYGIALDKAASDRMIALIRKDGQSVEEAIREKYSGLNGYTPVEVFLKENNIPYRHVDPWLELGW